MRVVGVTVVAALLVGGVTSCSAGGGADRDAAENEATPSVSVPASPLPTAQSRPAKAPLKVSGVRPQGMDVRYLDADGKVRVLKVEDFPR
jgi:hypothetical protein